MIINTGQRTDIPAFYSEWFANRLKEGIVCVRNPYYPNQVSRYRLDPSVVDCIGFCTKNPEPMFKYMNLLNQILLILSKELLKILILFQQKEQKLIHQKKKKIM